MLVAVLPVLACLAFLPRARAISPAPDGCYPNFTTAEGCDALSFLTTGAGNVAIGDAALASNVAGNFNIVVGWRAGLSVEGNDNIYIGDSAGFGIGAESFTTRIGNEAFVDACYIAGIID